MSEGCEQRERLPAALKEGYFQVDERRFEALVAMSAALGERLRFIDSTGQTSGHWGELFGGDEALVLARIVATELRVQQANFLRDADGAPLTVLAQQVLDLAKLIDTWLKWLRASEQGAGRVLRASLEAMLKHPLGADLAWLLEGFGHHLLQGEDLKAMRARLDSAWTSAPSLREASAHRTDRELLRRKFFSFVSAIERVQGLARDLLAKSLATQTHAPASSLLMTFLQLHQRVQQHINGFTARHADFYYDECLRVSPLPAVADKVHLVLKRSARAEGKVVVPRGTRFGAGKDASGQPIEFEADESITLTDCEVGALLTLKLTRDPLISPAREFGYVTRIEAARLPWPAPQTPLPDAPLPHWPIFGGSHPSGAPTLKSDTRIGVAFASPVLAMQAGQREIDLTLEFSHPVDTDRRLLHLAKRIEKPLRAKICIQLRLAVLFKRYLLLAPNLLGAQERGNVKALARTLAQRAHDRKSRERPPRQPSANGAAASPEEVTGWYEYFLVEWVAAAPTGALYAARMGRLFSRWLLGRHDWLNDSALKTLRDSASIMLGRGEHSAAGPGDPRSLLMKSGPPERALIFGQLFNSIFSFRMSTPAGWTELHDFYVEPRTGGTADAKGAYAGVHIVLRLSPQEPPVVACDPTLHGTDWPTDQPVLSIGLRDQGRLYAYSLLEELLLTDVALSVRVQGVRDVVMHNNLGRLDPSKPFMPFGPLPKLASYCVFGAPEIARKNVTRLGVNIEWSGLPLDDGGWARYYDAYGKRLGGTVFTATPAILRDGQWHGAGAPGSLPMFEMPDPAGRLSSQVHWQFNEPALRAHGRATHEPLDYQLGARNGFYRIQLHGPDLAFGHDIFPQLLTETVSAHAQLRRKRPLVLPNAPYTPLIERFTLDYEAQSHISLGRERNADDMASREQVLHLHPYGISQVYPGPAGAKPSLWPRFQHDGNLYIGLTASELSGQLTLHFHLRDESAVPSLNGLTRPAPQWAYLASDQWLPMPANRVVSDTTFGFLTSGIVTLDVPAQIDRQNTILPREFYWLRVSVDSDFDSFAGLYGVRTQALQASRVRQPGADTKVMSLPPGTVRETLSTLPGLAEVQQIGPSFGMRPAEDRQQMRTRIGERLAHRQRASTPWDYERLVLERFPSVLKVKCFPQPSEPKSNDRPGRVLVVVVPAPPVAHAPHEGHMQGTGVLSATAEPHLNAVEINRIADYLRGLASPYAGIQVRNAAYERVQVRCTLKLARGAQAGHALRRVNQAIIDYISPWREGGCEPGFDWTVRCEDVEAMIRQLDCVDFVTQLSLLQVARSDALDYALIDTARGHGALATRARPRSPWSIALPMAEHMLTVVDTPGHDRQEVSGIARLGLGSTFIVGEVVT